MNENKKAANKTAKRLAKLAEKGDIHDARSAAEGIAVLMHGPNGGNYNYDGRYQADTTQHAGERRDRPAGMGQ